MNQMLKSLGIGIIGYGGFGQFLHRSWSEMEGIHVRAVADANFETRSVVAEAAFYDDWHDLLEDPGVDIISIATPPFTHADIACAAMRCGKHVLIEKPLATTRQDAERIRAAAADTQRIAAVDYMLRFNPIVEVLQAWARDGSFGALRRIVVENYAQDESLSKDHWFWDAEKSGGILVEHAVHFIDIVIGCTDAEVSSTDGVAIAREDGRIDRMGLTAIFADGLITQQYHAFSRPGFFEETGMRFVFDLAQVDIDGWIPLRGRLTALVNPENLVALQRMPGLVIQERKRLDDLDDTSRPAGWGDSASGGRSEGDGGWRPNGEQKSVQSGGVAYQVTEQITGSFDLSVPKSVAYANAVRAMMADVAAAVRDPNHHPRAGLREGLRSLEIALSATQRAHRE